MKHKGLRIRRIATLFVTVVFIGVMIATNADMWQPQQQSQPPISVPQGSAAELLGTLAIKGRAPKTGYERAQFGGGWKLVDGCDTRNIILHRDLKQPIVGDGCKVLSGTLNDPYTGTIVLFERGADTSDDVQIDHVVALSNAWQTGAQQLDAQRRIELANDPLELLAVEGKANQQKSDGDAATWLPSNKTFRCQYVSRQVAVKAKYRLWVTQSEHDAISRVLSACPGQQSPSE